MYERHMPLYRSCSFSGTSFSMVSSPSSIISLLFSSILSRIFSSSSLRVFCCSSSSDTNGFVTSIFAFSYCFVTFSCCYITCCSFFLMLSSALSILVIFPFISLPRDTLVSQKIPQKLRKTH